MNGKLWVVAALLLAMPVCGVLLAAGSGTVKTAASAPATQASVPAETPRSLLGGKFLDVRGHAVMPAEVHTTAVVFVFINTECPISNKSIPELNRLAAVAAGVQANFFGVISDPEVTRAAALKHSEEYKIEFPVLFDASGTMAAALKPTHTPHAFVLTPEGAVAYSGRINDLFVALGKSRAAVTSNDLEDALKAVAAGKAPVAAETPLVGCIFESWKRPATGAKVTYTRDIAPILYANCTGCHREGEVAPFSLLTYKDASKRAEMLAAVTESKLMPPWKVTESAGHMLDERRLTAAQIALIGQWEEAGAPEGDAADLPALPKFTDGWHLGEPDMVVKVGKPFDVPAAGRDIMAYHVVPLNLPEDKYLVAFEYHPGNRKVVHHMIGFLDGSGSAKKKAESSGNGTTYVSFGGPGFLPTGGIGGWAPGAEPRFLPEGIGRPLRKGSDLVMQVHYHPSGKAETDQGEIALYFAKKPVTQIALNFPLLNRQINIPPGDEKYERTASLTIPVDVTLFGITPHMHNLGREMKVSATYPDGRQETLIYVNDWDWNWQDQYLYAKPIKLPAGTRIDLYARYDNSKNNPRNPQDPPQRVTWGEQTSNEMCIAFLQFTVDGLRAPLLEMVAGGLGGSGGSGGGAATQPLTADQTRVILERMRARRQAMQGQ